MLIHKSSDMSEGTKSPLAQCHWKSGSATGERRCGGLRTCVHGSCVTADVAYTDRTITSTDSCLRSFSRSTVLLSWLRHAVEILGWHGRLGGRHKHILRRFPTTQFDKPSLPLPPHLWCPNHVEEEDQETLRADEHAENDLESESQFLCIRSSCQEAKSPA